MRHNVRAPNFFRHSVVCPKASWAGLICHTQQHYHRQWLPKGIVGLRLYGNGTCFANAFFELILSTSLKGSLRNFNTYRVSVGREVVGFWWHLNLSFDIESYLILVHITSVLWHCWFGHLACKNRSWNDLSCVEWDLKSLHYFYSYNFVEIYVTTFPTWDYINNAGKCGNGRPAWWALAFLAAHHLYNSICCCTIPCFVFEMEIKYDWLIDQISGKFNLDLRPSLKMSVTRELLMVFSCIWCYIIWFYKLCKLNLAQR